MHVTDLEFMYSLYRHGGPKSRDTAQQIAHRLVNQLYPGHAPKTPQGPNDLQSTAGADGLTQGSQIHFDVSRGNSYGGRRGARGTGLLRSGEVDDRAIRKEHALRGDLMGPTGPANRPDTAHGLTGGTGDVPMLLRYRWCKSAVPVPSRYVCFTQTGTSIKLLFVSSSFFE